MARGREPQPLEAEDTFAVRFLFRRYRRSGKQGTATEDREDDHDLTSSS